MNYTHWFTRSKEQRASVLAGLIVLQAVCALFFVGDVVEDVRDAGHLDNPHLVLESVAAIALIGGVIFLLIELRRLLTRVSDLRVGLDIAKGHMADLVEEFFDEWRLTKSERDVAMMMLKGLDNESIARVRNTAPGTVRAQATSVYAKSNTDGRAQFISLFVEELLAGNDRLAAMPQEDASRG